MGIAFLGLEGEGEPGVGVLLEGFVGRVALGLEFVDGLLEQHLLEADFDLLGAEDAPGVGGELAGEEFLVGVAGSEVGFEAVLEGLEIGFILEGREGKLGGEAVLVGIEPGFGFAGCGAGSGGFLRILLTCGTLCFGDRTGHEVRVAWGIWVRRGWGDGVIF